MPKKFAFLSGDGVTIAVTAPGPKSHLGEKRLIDHVDWTAKIVSIGNDRSAMQEKECRRRWPGGGTIFFEGRLSFDQPLLWRGCVLGEFHCARLSVITFIELIAAWLSDA